MVSTNPCGGKVTAGLPAAFTLACLFGTGVILWPARAQAKGGAAIDAEWVAKGKSEGAAILLKYRGVQSELEERSEVQTESKKLPGIQTTTIHSVRLGENAILARAQFYPNTNRRPRISLECDNDDYYFTLGKFDKSSPYALTTYGKGKRKTPTWKSAGGIHGEVISYLQTAIDALAPGNMADLRAIRFDAAAKLLTIERVRKQGNSTIVERFVIDPHESWSIRRRQVETATSIGDFEYAYGKVIDGLHFPTRAVMSITFLGANAAKSSRITVRILEIKRTEKTLADFRMSAFGFPEPNDVAPLPRPMPWHVWMLAAGGACGVLGFCLAYLRKWLAGRRVTGR